ncbi:MAG TPA: DUF1223 domain-containing protein [Caulobacteraceae bacterium]|nr:DUF1223 domain-containing protein [Caulobacteraceae bacterium]
MKRALLALGFVAGLTGPAQARIGDSAVVELFTAQGCAPCVKVGDEVNELAGRPKTIVVTWPVDYWDYLGWKDTFAQPEFDDRQRAYDHRFGFRDVFTPQVVVDGDIQGSGAQPGKLEEMIRQTRRELRDPPQMSFIGTDRVAVGSGPRPKRPADVWLVRYDPREQSVDVKTGDNRGKTITQKDVARQLVRLGLWRGSPRVFHLPASPAEGLTTLVLLQEDRGGKILAADEKPTAPSPPS